MPRNSGMTYMRRSGRRRQQRPSADVTVAIDRPCATSGTWVATVSTDRTNAVRHRAASGFADAVADRAWCSTRRSVDNQQRQEAMALPEVAPTASGPATGDARRQSLNMADDTLRGDVPTDARVCRVADVTDFDTKGTATWRTTSSTRCRHFKLASGKSGKFYSLPALAKTFPDGLAAAGVDPHRARVGAAQLRRQEGHRGARARSSPTGSRTPTRTDEIPFVVARVVLQDFTGVPLLADLAAMRNVAARAGQGPEDDRAAGAGRPGGRPLGDDRPLRHARTRSTST